MAENFECLETLRLAAHHLRGLQRLKPGQWYGISPQEMRDVDLPVSPLERLDGPFICKWICDRLPFKCEWDEDIVSGYWVFRRPKHCGPEFWERGVPDKPVFPE